MSLPRLDVRFDTDLSTLPIDGDGGLKHMRMVVNFRWMDALRHDNEELMSHYMNIHNQIKAELKRRQEIAR